MLLKKKMELEMLEMQKKHEEESQEKKVGTVG